MALDGLERRPARRVLGELDHQPARARCGMPRAFTHSSGRRLISAAAVTTTAPFQKPAPAAIPIAATSQRLAAVVRPRTVNPCRKMSAGAEEADPGHDLGRDPWSGRRSAVREVLEPVRAGHREERGADRDEHVRAQAGRLLVELALETDRDRPGRPRRRCERSTRARSGAGQARGASTAACCFASISAIPPGGELEQLVELVAAERNPLGGRLHLDEPPVAGHHDVQVDVGVRVLGVVEVEQRARRRRSRARPPRPSPASPSRARSGRGHGGRRHTSRRSPRSACRRRPGGRRSRARACARRAP